MFVNIIRSFIFLVPNKISLYIIPLILKVQTDVVALIKKQTSFNEDQNNNLLKNILCLKQYISELDC